ncbi:hypothetical protein [Phaeobacter sp. HF9A]|uniref:hypothetical protein n=1 Tax=Phaeobacter sp. HF9A TaxID=2721561 RepID=UPI001589168A|nr:hypothetical protein [Phaeobacter sp. HF9A]
MKFTTILATLALTLSAPAFAQDAKGAEKQSAPASAADTQERATGNGKGTRATTRQISAQVDLM